MLRALWCSRNTHGAIVVMTNLFVGAAASLGYGLLGGAAYWGSIIGLFAVRWSTLAIVDLAILTFVIPAVVIGVYWLTSPPRITILSNWATAISMLFGIWLLGPTAANVMWAPFAVPRVDLATYFQQTLLFPKYTLIVAGESVNLLGLAVVSLGLGGITCREWYLLHRARSSARTETS